MLNFILQTIDPPLPASRNYDAPEPFSISPTFNPECENELDLTCLCLIRRKKGKKMSMKILRRNYASE